MWQIDSLDNSIKLYRHHIVTGIFPFFLPAVKLLDLDPHYRINSKEAICSHQLNVGELRRQIGTSFLLFPFQLSRESSFPAEQVEHQLHSSTCESRRRYTQHTIMTIGTTIQESFTSYATRWICVCPFIDKQTIPAPNKQLLFTSA